jgi:hypothetical protein
MEGDEVRTVSGLARSSTTESDSATNSDAAVSADDAVGRNGGGCVVDPEAARESADGSGTAPNLLSRPSPEPTAEAAADADSVSTAAGGGNGVEAAATAAVNGGVKGGAVDAVGDECEESN